MSEPQEQTEAQKKLNPKQERFCQLYATDREFFGNGVESYMEAYDPDRNDPNWYESARRAASRLLTNVDILCRINELIDLELNDAHVDKQLNLVITQNADYRSKVAAIGEYNKVKGRITKKLEVTSPTPILGGLIKDVPADNSPDENSEPQQET